MPIAVPVPPVPRVVGEAIVTLRAHACQATDGLSTRAEPVREVILRARQLDQMDTAYGRRVQRDAEGADARPTVDHERGVRSGRGRACGRRPGDRRQAHRDQGGDHHDRGRDQTPEHDRRYGRHVVAQGVPSATGVTGSGSRRNPSTAPIDAPTSFPVRLPASVNE